MRLLKLSDAGDFSLTKEFIGNDDPPPYAILSHTWEEDEDELTFKDMELGNGKNKPGYKKIRFCGTQAAKDGLHYIWIDTCCINKSNHVELAEAINSMFRWYSKAVKCYVYLSDISISNHSENDQLSTSIFESSFRACKWFTRGWTLQELIAPASVEFFSIEGKLLGNKKILEKQICEITGIPVKALQGGPLSQFPVEERISWQGKRETKREEDKAYSLMGIFDVYMSPIYGEGRKNAFIRLREEINKHSNSKSCASSVPPFE
jgi:heterokaryon incompatibility protein (HET)